MFHQKNFYQKGQGRILTLPSFLALFVFASLKSYLLAPLTHLDGEHFYETVGGTSSRASSLDGETQSVWSDGGEFDETFLNHVASCLINKSFSKEFRFLDEDQQSFLTNLGEVFLGKKIQDPAGYKNFVSAYVREHSQALCEGLGLEQGSAQAKKMLAMLQKEIPVRDLVSLLCRFGLKGRHEQEEVSGLLKSLVNATDPFTGKAQKNGFLNIKTVKDQVAQALVQALSPGEQLTVWQRFNPYGKGVRTVSKKSVIDFASFLVAECILTYADLGALHQQWSDSDEVRDMEGRGVMATDFFSAVGQSAAPAA